MEPVPGVVRAYDVTDFDPAPDASSPAKLRLLWQQEGFTYSKFCPPVVADGKLLVPTYDGRVDVYELQQAMMRRCEPRHRPCIDGAVLRERETGSRAMMGSRSVN